MLKKIWIVLGAAVLLGCSSQRPLHIVQQSGQRNYDKGDYVAAAADFKEYTDRRPAFLPARYSLGQSYMELGEYSLAREQFALCLGVDGGNEAYADALAEALLAANEREALMAHLHRVCGERGRVNDYLRLGRYAMKIGNVDEAQTALATAARIDGGRSVAPQLALAEMHRSLGDRQGELRRLAMALYLDPGNLKIQERIRELGEVPGPTFAAVPAELE